MVLGHITGDSSSVAINKDSGINPIKIVIPNNKELLYKFVITYLKSAGTIGEVWVMFSTEKSNNMPLCFDIKYNHEVGDAMLKNCVAMFDSHRRVISLCKTIN